MGVEWRGGRAGEEKAGKWQPPYPWQAPCNWAACISINTQLRRTKKPLLHSKYLKVKI